MSQPMYINSLIRQLNCWDLSKMEGKELRATIKRKLRELGYRNFKNDVEADLAADEIANEIEKIATGGSPKKSRQVSKHGEGEPWMYTQ